jgi:hypothetical protein
MPWNPEGKRERLDWAENLIVMNGLGAAMANDLRRAAMQIDQPGWETSDWAEMGRACHPKNFPPKKQEKHHVACDLDGTLAHYDGWKGIEHIGSPIPAVLARVKGLLEAGHQVSIYTSRVAGDWPEHIKDLEATRRHIERWCYEHIGRILPITAVKHGWFTEFWDDKALGIRENQGMPVTTRDAWIAYGLG